MNKWMLAAFAAAVLGAGSANSETVVVNQVFDVNAGWGGPVVQHQDLLDTPVQLSPGDTLDLTLTALPGQSISFPGLVFIEMGLDFPDGTGTVASTLTGRLSIFDGATLVATSAETTQAITQPGLRLNFLPAMLGTPGAFNATSFNLVFSVDALQGGARPLAFYDLRYHAGPIPEPTAWALMIGGFAMTGGALRRRRALA